MSELRVGLLGCGVVGSAVARRLLSRADEIGARVGRPVSLGRVAVRDVAKSRPVVLPPGVLTDNAFCVATDVGLDVVVEAIGGVQPAADLVSAALRSGKHVVTANKQLLARHGRDLHRLAADNGVTVHYEASVCGAVPVVSVLGRSLAGDRVERLEAIVNGTTNYVLTTMARRRCSLADALAEARDAGYAEPCPDDDLSGADAAAKTAVLARLAFGADVALGDVPYEGIGHVTEDLVEAASASGRTLKLVSEVARAGGSVAASVRLRALEPDHELASVDGVDNAVVVTTECAGRLVLRGPGAGGDATASAVLGDLVAALGRIVDDMM